jgi:hypothetical protein
MKAIDEYDVREAFEALDLAGWGTISSSDLQTLLWGLGYGPTESEYIKAQRQRPPASDAERYSLQQVLETVKEVRKRKEGGLFVWKQPSKARLLARRSNRGNARCTVFILGPEKCLFSSAETREEYGVVSRLLQWGLPVCVELCSTAAQMSFDMSFGALIENAILVYI